MEVYESQYGEIRRIAKQQGVSEAGLAELIEKQTKEVKFMFPDQTRNWIRYRVEKEVWNKITKEKFPGRMPMTDNLIPRNDENRRQSTSRSDVASQLWIHDKFNLSPGPPRAREPAPLKSGHVDSYRPSSSPIASRMREAEGSREIDSWKPAASSISRSREIDSYRPSSSSSNTAVPRPTTSRRSRRPSSSGSLHSITKPITSQNPNISSSMVTISQTPAQQFAAQQPLNTRYITQDAFIRKKILEMGVTEDEYSAAHRRFTREVNQRHSIQHVTPQWLLWRKERLLWQQFLPKIPFPGIEPVMVHSPSSDAYTSRWRSIEKKALADNVPLSVVEAYYKERVQFAERHFSQNLQSWKSWFAESTTWSHFWTDQFHGIEPLKHAQVAPLTSKRPSVSFAPLDPAPRHANVSSNDNTTSPFVSTVYQIQEKVMVSKAEEQGIRSEFFRYLQYARDWARSTHPHCTKDVRNYLADKKTWQRFFDDEEFPGIKPFGGHSAECISRTSRLAKTSSRSGNNQITSLQGPRQSQTFSENISSHPSRSLFPSIKPGGFPATFPEPEVATGGNSQESQLSIAYINVQYENGGAPVTLGRATKAAVTTFTVDGVLATQVGDAFRRDDAMKMHRLEDKLKCRLEGAQGIGSLTCTIKPFQSNDAASFELAFRYVVSWVETCVRGDIKTLSSFANSFSSNPKVKDANVITAPALASPISLLVNGKYVPLDSREYARIQRMFSEDRNGRVMLEWEESCRFLLVDFDGDVNLKHLLAVSSNNIDYLESRSLDPYVVLWHPEEGDAMNLFLQRWTIRVAGCMDDSDAPPSIPAFWKEYEDFLSRDNSRAVSPNFDGGNDGMPSGKVGDRDLDDMIMEESTKAFDPSQYAGAYSNDALSGYQGYSAPVSAAESSYNMPGSLVDQSRNSVGDGAGGEKRKLEEDNNNSDDDGDAEEGEIVEAQHTKKRVKF